MTKISNTPLERTLITPPYVWCSDVFSLKEIDNIVEYCESISNQIVKELNNIKRPIMIHAMDLGKNNVIKINYEFIN